jgi:hypothetical protein
MRCRRAATSSGSKKKRPLNWAAVWRRWSIRRVGMMAERRAQCCLGMPGESVRPHHVGRVPIHREPDRGSGLLYLILYSCHSQRLCHSRRESHKPLSRPRLSRFPTNVICRQVVYHAGTKYASVLILRFPAGMTKIGRAISTGRNSPTGIGGDQPCYASKSWISSMPAGRPFSVIRIVSTFVFLKRFAASFNKALPSMEIGVL